MRRGAILSVLLVLFLWGKDTAPGQFPFLPKAPEGTAFQPQQVYFEAINLPGDNPAESLVDVLFRIDEGFFIAVRNEDASLSSAFVRRGDVVVELLDSNRVSVARNLLRVLHPSFTEANRAPARKWITGRISLSVPPGRYFIAMSVEDRESLRRFQDQRRMVVASDFSAGPPMMSTPFLVSFADSAQLIPTNYGGGFRFGASARAAFVLTNLADQSPLQVSFTIEQIETPDTYAGTPITDTVTQIRPQGPIQLHPDTVDPAYRVETTGERHYLVVVPLPVASLAAGLYKMEMTVWNERVRLTRPVTLNTAWPDMPRSLRDPAYAISCLRHIVSEDELDSLDSGNGEALRRNLFAFWKPKDRTPESAYNEVMVEYYSRVDYSSAHFGTLRQPDGAFSDRGYVYIIHGPPARTERKLDPDGYREVWYYDGNGKTFVFLDRTRTGDYILSQTAQ